MNIHYPPRIYFDPEASGGSSTVSVTYFRRNTGSGDDGDVFAQVRYELSDQYPVFPELEEMSKTCQRSRLMLEILHNDINYRDWIYYDLCPREESHRVFVRLVLDSVPVPESGSIPKIGYGSYSGQLTILCPDHSPQARQKPPKSHITYVIGPGEKHWGHHSFKFDYTPIYPYSSTSLLPEKSPPSKPHCFLDFTQGEEFKTARKWLRDCKNSHDSCNVNKGDFRPSRLLNISKGIERLRIQIGRDIQNVRIYATLSYCWGLLDLRNVAKSSYVTTLDNLDERLGGFSGIKDRLPSTIVDAIGLASALGFDYLWVDSLCILQRNAKDWGEQSCQMDFIYGCSSLTIVAREPVEASEGFIAFHDPPSVDGIIPIFDYALAATSKTPTTAVQAAPRYCWKSRGWTLQEEALSRRILYCVEDSNSNQENGSGGRKLLLEFECLRHHVRVPRLGKRSNALPSQVQPWTRSLGLSNRNNIDWIWREKVEDYSARTLTYESDIFYALSGITREFASIVTKPVGEDGPGYLAGLWQNTIYIDLCWTTESNRSLQSRGESVLWTKDPDCSGVAPSWSWVSLPVGSGVRWDRSLERYGHETFAFVKLIDHWVEPLTSDKFGPIMKNGYIILKCKLLPANKVTNEITQRDYEVLFLVQGEDRDDNERWKVYHGIVLERDFRTRGNGYRRVGSISVGKVDAVDDMLKALEGEDTYNIKIV